MNSTPFFTRLISGKDIPIAALPLRGVLIVLSWVYSLVVWIRNFGFDNGLFRVSKVSIPVISVGNLSCGGTGKTPFVLWLAKKLREKGHSPVVLSRGYGKSKGSELNEEALMLAKSGVSVICNPNRVEGATELAREGGFSCIILDDGFQHRLLDRDKNIVLIDATIPPWEDSMLPAGFLRETYSSLSRADLIVLTRTEQVENSEEIISRLREEFPDKPIFASQFKPINLIDPDSGAVFDVKHIASKAVGAFCGLGNPDQFFTSIEMSGAKIEWRQVFSDHHSYSTTDIDKIEAKADSSGVEYIITSLKDWVKCEPIDRNRKYLIFHVDFETQDEEKLLFEISHTWSQNENTVHSSY